MRAERSIVIFPQPNDSGTIHDYPFIFCAEMKLRAASLVGTDVAAVDKGRGSGPFFPFGEI